MFTFTKTNLQVFVDVDNMDDTAELKELVSRSQVVLLFLTEGVFASFWVRVLSYY